MSQRHSDAAMPDRSAQRLVIPLSGLLLGFFAFGFGAWFSGVASWVGFYAGARGDTLVAFAQAAAWVGVAAGVGGGLQWYRRRCRRGRIDVPTRGVVAACAVLALGNIFWAIFVDAIAYHYGQDIVRPAFDQAMMYLVLGTLPPLALVVPWIVIRLRRVGRRVPLN